MLNSVRHKPWQKTQLCGLYKTQDGSIIAVIFVGVFVDANRASEVVAYGVGAGALVTGLAVFAYATRKPSIDLKSPKQTP